MSLPRFGPVLMPDTTSRGRSGARPKRPSATQSEGVPSLEYALRRVPGRVISVTRSGRSSVLVWPAAVQFRLGAITHTASTRVKALASALRPGESTPSSLVTRIIAQSVTTSAARYTLASSPILDELDLLIGRARDVAERA